MAEKQVAPSANAGESSPHEALTYRYAELTVISVHFPSSAIISDLRVAVCDLSPETEMILGMDAITQMDFAITNGNGQTQFSFAIPPRKDKIDFTKS
jgi:hypothetical protein